ncbi:hypothetical protein GCM10022217_18630 [Chryseobacterium ginsenosidimutans]
MKPEAINPKPIFSLKSFYNKYLFNIKVTKNGNKTITACIIFHIGKKDPSATSLRMTPANYRATNNGWYSQCHPEREAVEGFIIFFLFKMSNPPTPENGPTDTKDFLFCH